MGYCPSGLCQYAKGRILTCKAVSLMPMAPAEIQATNRSLSFLLLVNKYAASGFAPELTTSKLSSTLSTCSSPKLRQEKDCVLHYPYKKEQFPYAYIQPFAYMHIHN